MKGTRKKVREASGESENTKEGRKIKVMKESYRCQKKLRKKTKVERRNGKRKPEEKKRRDENNGGTEEINFSRKHNECQREEGK